MSSATLPKIEGLKLLVVDDEETFCQSVEKILSKNGHETDAASTVTDALEILGSGKKYDLVIADLVMPQAGGLELLTSLKATQPDLPVLITAGIASIASAVESIKSGAAGYLPKPFTPEELEKAVETIMATQAADAKNQSAPTLSMLQQNENVESKANVESAVAAAKPLAPADFCPLGQRSCKRYEKKGVCQQDECPIVVNERKKGKTAEVTQLVFDPIDVDMPFSAAEVALMTSEAYVAALGKSDAPLTGQWGQFAPSAKKVLVVDDESIAVNSMRKILSRRGFLVEEAFSCKEALALVFSHDFDLVLLDARLKDGDGLDVLQKIKKSKPAVRVSIVTGYASIDAAIDAIRKGASDYLPKPFTPDELYVMAARSLGIAVPAKAPTN